MSSKSAPEPRPGRRAWSLAARLTAWYTLSAFALVLGATGFLYWALATNLDREDDEGLADEARLLGAALRRQPADLDALKREAARVPAAHLPSRVDVRILFIRVQNADGRWLVETPGMAEELPSGVFPAPAGTDLEPGGGADVLRDRESYRVLVTRADGAVIQVALNRTREDNLLAEYRHSMWLVLALALAGCALVGYQVARRGLRPLHEIAATARRIRSTTLAEERLAAAGLPAEIAELADTLNDMLGRLEESFARLARFSADIAHELRTPVNNLRGEAEVALGRPRSPEEYREVLGSCLEECGRLARLIDSLLFIARAEDPRTQVERERVDVGRELAAVREFYEAAAAEAGVTLTADAPAGLAADVNRPLLQRAVGNLVANALAYTGPGGRVALTAARDGGGVRIEVADTGCGIAAEHLPHLFDRFYRADRARSSAGGGGVGLGLAIVKTIADLHGGSVSLASEVGHGTRVTLRFPAPAGREEAAGKE
jgi:two-component system heavy metal sensor histidine kinase CusS